MPLSSSEHSIVVLGDRYFEGLAVAAYLARNRYPTVVIRGAERAPLDEKPLTYHASFAFEQSLRRLGLASSESVGFEPHPFKYALVTPRFRIDVSNSKEALDAEITRELPHVAPILIDLLSRMRAYVELGQVFDAREFSHDLKTLLKQEPETIPLLRASLLMSRNRLVDTLSVSDAQLALHDLASPMIRLSAAAHLELKGRLLREVERHGSEVLDLSKAKGFSKRLRSLTRLQTRHGTKRVRAVMLNEAGVPAWVHSLLEPTQLAEKLRSSSAHFRSSLRPQTVRFELSEGKLPLGIKPTVLSVAHPDQAWEGDNCLWVESQHAPHQADLVSVSFLANQGLTPSSPSTRGDPKRLLFSLSQSLRQLIPFLDFETLPTPTIDELEVGKGRTPLAEHIFYHKPRGTSGPIPPALGAINLFGLSPQYRPYHGPAQGVPELLDWASHFLSHRGSLLSRI